MSLGEQTAYNFSDSDSLHSCLFLSLKPVIQPYGNHISERRFSCTRSTGHENIGKAGHARGTMCERKGSTGVLMIFPRESAFCYECILPFLCAGTREGRSFIHTISHSSKTNRMSVKERKQIPEQKITCHSE